ncbi:MAG: hypothetical protein OXU70_14570 [Gammaproteobacteria bacterium]|nr:hypothetical protein [Gammaproteobacteria bacterium]
MNGKSKRFVCALLASAAMVAVANTNPWIDGCTSEWNASSAAESCTLTSMEVNDTYESVGVELPFCTVKARCKEEWHPQLNWQTYNDDEYTGTTLDMHQLVNCDGRLHLNNCPSYF